MRALANAVIAVGLVFVVGLALRGYSASRATAPPIVVGQSPKPQRQDAPSPVVKSETGRRVIASAPTNYQRCDVPGSVNGVALTLEIDTGNPVVLALASSYIKRLSLNPGQWRELDPGTRYEKIANATAKEIRIGDVVWINEQVEIFSNWKYTFGDDEIPLLGLAALRSQGVNVEFEGGYCRLTVAQTAAPQCGEYALSKLRGDKALSQCQGQCSAVPFCRRLTTR